MYPAVAPSSPHPANSSIIQACNCRLIITAMHHCRTTKNSMRTTFLSSFPCNTSKSNLAVVIVTKVVDNNTPVKMADESTNSEERNNEDLMNKYEDDDRYSTWTECIGFESMNETSKTVELEPGHTTVESRSRNTDKMTQPEEFPATLPSLTKNGRPMFYQVKTRGNGRLQIVMFPINHPAVLVERTSGEGDKVRIGFTINDDHFDR